MRQRIKSTEAFTTWLDKLGDITGRARVQVRIERLRAGNPGNFRRLKYGVSELKIGVGPGYRVYFCVDEEGALVLLCGGDKSTQKNDIRLAYALAQGLETYDEN